MVKSLIYLKLVFANKAALIILLTSIVFLTSEIKLLEKYASVGKAKVIITTDVLHTNAPLYTLGYLDILKNNINSSLNKQSWQCRSLNLKVSTHANLVFHDFEMYCEVNPFENHKLSLDELISSELKRFPENKLQTLEHYEFVAYNKGSDFHILLSICYVLILLMALPWYPLIAKK